MVGVEEAFDRAFELAARLAEMMREALAERGLSPARAEVVYVLSRRGPVMQRELAQALGCTPRHVTGLIDALAADRLVERQPHPQDRRASQVALTEHGASTAGWMNQQRRESARVLLGDVPARDLAGFVRVTDQLLHGLTDRGAVTARAGGR